MWHHFTERARRAVYYAQEFASRNSLSLVTVEGLCLGLLSVDGSRCLAALQRMDIPLEDLRAEIEAASISEPENRPERPTLTASAKRAVELGVREAKRSGRREVGTEHLLLGVVVEGGSASRILAKWGANLEAMRNAISEVYLLAEDDGGAEEESSILQRCVGSDELGLRRTSLLSMADLNGDQIIGILDCADELRIRRSAGGPLDWNGRKSLVMIFEKPSLRTRVTFELGMKELGGNTIILGPAEIGLGVRESVADVARNLDRWVSAIMARVRSHETLVELHQHSSVPIINALSDCEHPCQTLADLQALRQRKGRLAGLALAWIGDGNNVLHSLMLGAAQVGIRLRYACPPGYGPDVSILERARALAADTEAEIEAMDPLEAAEGADAIYTDVWASMGQEDEREERRRAFSEYQVNARMMDRAAPDAVFMHCLPAHRGDEVTDEVLDGANSIVLEQAENRLHAQKAVLALTLGP
ncbi:MAG: ornithine carbamoyltransferase [Chthonomonadales bacterium]|nr:ornithine carbamoyltransferase [Chthonomonadales bacterium]